jgi:hypothetical protein
LIVLALSWRRGRQEPCTPKDHTTARVKAWERRLGASNPMCSCPIGRLVWEHALVLKPFQPIAKRVLGIQEILEAMATQFQTT